MTLGKLYGISVGTGDPELITLKGLRLLENCPVVAFPRGKGEKLGYAQEIILSWLKPEQKTLSLDFPYVSSEKILQQAWGKSALEVWEFLQQGQDVAFACEGDVSFYSTFNYLAQTLKKLHPEIIIQTVPGVSSPMAAASALGTALTCQDQSLVILPTLYHLQDLERVLIWADVVVLLKVASVYQQVWQLLAEYQLLEVSSCVEFATTPKQVVYNPLTNYPNLSLSYFSLLIIHAHLKKIDNYE